MDKQEELEDCIDAEEIGKILHLQAQTIRLRAKRDELFPLPCMHIGKKRLWRKKDIYNYIEKVNKIRQYKKKECENTD